jgi:hypothetical protein
MKSDMSKLQPLSDDQREELVAYLDGELDAKTAQSLELKLSQDPRYSAEAASLSKSWSMLDYLASPEPTSTFTSRTLERISAFRPPTSPGSGIKRWQTWALACGWVGMVTLSAGLGYATVNRYTAPIPPAQASQAQPPAQANEQVARQHLIERLPKAYQDKLHQLEADPARYDQQLKAYQQEIKGRQEEWRRAVDNWDNMERRRAQLMRLQPQIKTFIQESLTPLLTTEEKIRLKEAQPPPDGHGDWPRFLTVLVELSDQHPIRLPPSPKTGPAKFEDLPAQLQTRLKAASGWPTREAQAAHGKWPDYPLAVWDFLMKKKMVARALPGPSHLEDYAPAVQKFCKEDLFPKLKPEQHENLHKAEGLWPRYPRLLVRLSAGKMPGMKLPGPADLWQPFRESLSASR